MNDRLMLTRLLIPPLRPNAVARTALIERLREGMEQRQTLTLISAPAGFGKTALVVEWIGGVERAAAWITLDETDNDPLQFLRILVAALQQVQPYIGEMVQPFLSAPQPAPLLTLMTLLINDIAAAPPFMLVFDDAHLITAEAVWQALALLIERQPPTLHVVICTRADLPLPLARLRARGQVNEIRERDLRFSLEEAAAFFQQTMGLLLPAEAINALSDRTEGWIVGLQLAALALQESDANIDTFIAGFKGDDRYIVDYLISEVMQRLPEDARAFLRSTSILNRMNASLCAALTGRTDSQAMLEQLEAANLFLIALDRRRQWFRYHRLFAESLSLLLAPDEQTSLHERAMAWHESNGFPEQAVQHALAAADLSGDPAAAIRLICRAAGDVMQGGGLSTLKNWLSAPPVAALTGELSVYRGWIAILSGDLEQTAAHIHAALDTTDLNAAARSQLLLLQGYAALAQNDYDAAVDLTTAALSSMDAAQIQWRLMALWALAEAQERARSLTEAIHSLREAQRSGRALGSQISAALIDSSLAAALNETGQRLEAAAVCEDALARFGFDPARLSPITAIILARLALIEYEANHLERAAEYLMHCLSLSDHGVLSELNAFLHGVMALVHHASGDGSAALSELRRSHQYTAQLAMSDAGWIDAWEVNIRLAQGDLAFARQWGERQKARLNSLPTHLTADEHLAYARVLLAQKQRSEAEHALTRLETFARKHTSGRRLITVYILKALLFEDSGDRARALDALATALRLAAPQDYIRAFLDEDARILELLSYNRPLYPLFVDQLLNEARHTRSRESVPSQPLIEPLSERELEVLRLIDAGLSNAEIAERLFISQGTVKRHINHIYGKLSVGSRTQALAKARELRLLD